MEDLLKYHIDETRDRFEEIKSDILSLQGKIDDLREFKIQLIATSRLTSMIVSAVCGLVTMIISAVLSIKFKGE